MDHRANAPSQAGRRLPLRLLAALCVLMLLAGVLPLYAVSLYNHPYYDDFGFSADVRAAWLATRSVGAVLRAAWQSAQSVRATWQGTYTGTLLSNLQPGVFSESDYWLTTFFLLTAFLLCFGLLLKTVFRDVLGAGRAETAILVSLPLFLMTQLLPEPDEAFFWFNGGIGNTFIYSLLALALAMMIRLSRARRGAPWLAAGLMALSTLLGGGSYGGGLFGLLIFLFVAGYAFAAKHRYRLIYAAVTVWFGLCFAYNVSAPGNAVRAAMIGAHPSAVKAVLQSLYYGTATIGHSLTLPVLAAGLGLAPLLYRLARESRFRFRHPLWALAGGAALYCAQLTPPLYAGVFLGGGRITDTYYYSLIVLLLLYETYALGALARRRERAAAPHVTLTAVARRRLALACACLFLLGCAGYKQPGDTLYGPMNMAGGSAALSLVTGEARRYDREMSAREALLNDPAQPVVTLSPLTSTPRVFMEDLLTPGATYDMRPMLCRYYGKDAILLEGGAAP